MEAGRSAEVLRIEMRDDGRGFDPQTVRAGRGLSNMRRRAEAIGADLEIASGDGGSRVTLTLSWSEIAV